MNKHIFKIFSPSGSHTILVFPYQMGWQCSHANPPNGESHYKAPYNIRYLYCAEL